ncbi:hypothetical protein [Bifidobacterium sp. SO1]|uniref:hypothetical protein n=1 Tax=Bifidobacterium sp. SO1 TaxID=2809029 RepID=UPI001BDDA889|nr:hypothetical protein [Bifidobacterium sp. SO1]MBT1162117.1 hypothetical protein [Bifidobacterium sp. SO1]
MPTKPKVTAVDIEAALADRYRRTGSGFLPQIEVDDPHGLLRLDGVGLEWSYRRMWISGFEIKVSRSDFLRDAKYTLYRNYVDDMTLVCPARMIDRDELPDGIGLLWYDPHAKPGRPRLRYRRKPEPSNGDTRQVEQQLLRRLTRADVPAGRYGRYESARQYVEEKTALKNIGEALGSKMARRITELERLQEPSHRRAMEDRAEAYDRLVGILNAHGFDQITLTSRGTQLDHGLARLDRALTASAPVEAIDRETRYAIDTLKYLRELVGLDREQEEKELL